MVKIYEKANMIKPVLIKVDVALLSLTRTIWRFCDLQGREAGGGRGLLGLNGG